MDYNFTGALTQRSINLGSAQEISSAQLAQQARDQRAVRQEIRARHAAATCIQSLYRGRQSAAEIRAEQRRLSFSLLSEQQQQQQQDIAGPSRLPHFVELTRLVAASTQRPLLEKRWRKVKSANRPVILSRAEATALDEDDTILLPWAQYALLPSGDGAMAPMLLEPLPQAHVDNRSTYITALKVLLSTLLSHLEIRTAQAQINYQPFLQVILSILDVPTSSPTGQHASQDTWPVWLVRKGLYASVKSHLIELTARSKPTSPSLSLAVSIAMAPLQHPVTGSAVKSNKDTIGTSPRDIILRSFVGDFLTIHNLPNRVPRISLAQLAIDLPVVEVAETIVAEWSRKNRQQHWQPSANLLATFVALTWKRIQHFTQGASLKAYLLALTSLQDSIPSGVLRTTSKDSKLLPADALMDDEDDDYVQYALSKTSVSAKSLDSQTLTRLQLLTSQEHISALLTCSARYPNSTREVLCSFLASSLHSWDPQTQDKILACIAYRYSGSPTAGAARSNQHSIGGLVRELWRGWIRGSKLARGLSSEALQSRKSLMTILDDESVKQTWPCLVILCQLYSRSLLTIGDDEFYPDPSNFGEQASTSSPAAGQSSMRNPLTLDEVVTLSGLLRNLAFGMYWFEGTGGALNDLLHNSVVGMPKLDLLSLRNIVTRLLQQLHQRDSRRSFAPTGHWLMTSELDLQSFIQSVVMEEDELNRNQEGAQDVTADMAMDIDQSQEDDEDPRRAADESDVELDGSIQNTQRPSISARLANHRSVPTKGKALTARSLAYLSPRLGVLNNIPFVIPFEVRVEIFHQFTALDYERLRRKKSFQGYIREVTIRRGSVAEDGFKQLRGLGENLKHRFGIKFVDQFGIEESGIDGGGLFKEFLTSLIKEAFDTDRGLWIATSDQQLYPNPHSYARTEENLEWYRFLGRILGKALYQGILVDINFASFFLSKWLGRGHGYLDDLSGLESLDKEVYRNLLWLKHYSGDVEKDLALDFTVVDEEFGEKHVHELVPNGKNVAVTRENRLEYIYRVSHYRLNEQIRLQSEAFLSGLTDLIDLRWLRMLNREELRILISGAEGDIDLQDLRANTVLGGYHEKDEVLTYFWTSLASFTHDQRKSFLKFATSCPSPPLLGFAQLNPKFGIRHAGDDTERLPTASTCVNLLKLPRYTTYEQCREKLLYAIESGAGFDLS